MRLETEPRGILKLTIDTTDKCNLKCAYCLQGDKGRTSLPGQKITETLVAAEERGLLETYLVGQEMTLHPDLEQILEATHVLDKTGSVMLTNGTLLNPQMIHWIEKSNLSRVCISIDGATPEDHNHHRGNNFDKVMGGLHLLQETGKPIVVISVATQSNVDRIHELSEFLATKQLAQQHHIIAVTKSGLAKEEFDEMKISMKSILELQDRVDNRHKDLKESGLFTAFSSYWPTTGELPPSRDPRLLTTFEISEQLKRSNLVLRANGAMTPTVNAWAREFATGNNAIGNVLVTNPGILIGMAEEIYEKNPPQLTRETEARQKYGLETQDKEYEVETIPLVEIDDMPVLAIPLLEGQLEDLAKGILSNEGDYRAIKTSGETIIVYHKPSSHAILLKPDEFDDLSDLINEK